MAKILNTEETEIGLKVTIEGFAHAFPVFESGLTENKLKKAVDDWVEIQEGIDRINDGTATNEDKDKYKPKDNDPEPISIITAKLTKNGNYGHMQFLNGMLIDHKQAT